MLALPACCGQCKHTQLCSVLGTGAQRGGWETEPDFREEGANTPSQATGRLRVARAMGTGQGPRMHFGLSLDSSEFWIRPLICINHGGLQLPPR